MIGVRKNSGVIRLLMAAALVLFVAACSSSSNNSGIERERDQALETVEELEGTVLDLTGTVDDLMVQLAALQESGTDAAQEKIEMLEARIAELEGIEQGVKDEEEKMKRASVLALFKGLDPAFNVADDGFSAAGFAVAATHGKATKVTPAAAEADGPANNKLAAATGMMSDAQGPWSSTVVSAQDTGTKDTDTVVVFTDIAPDKTVPFGDVHTLTTEGLVDVMDADAKYVASSMLPTAPGVMVHNPDKAEPNDEIRIPGTFDGATGEYRCDEGGTEGACESQGANKGGVQLNGPWFFDPDVGAMARKVDAEYSHFGWWWRVDAAGAYYVDVFNGNTMGTALADFNELTGTATYVGPAAGKFAISPQLPDTTPMGGHFTATATLMADFEKGTGPDPAGEMSGSIDDFMQDDLELPFVMTFPGVPINTTNPAHFSGTNAAWTISGVKSTSDGSGSWSGNFHNKAGDDVPTTVTGEFAATYNEEVGRIEGAFGATLQSE